MIRSSGALFCVGSMSTLIVIYLVSLFATPVQASSFINPNLISTVSGGVSGDFHLYRFVDNGNECYLAAGGTTMSGSARAAVAITCVK